MGEAARVASIEGEQRHALPEYAWEELSEPGTYVEKETGRSLSNSQGAASSRDATVDLPGKVADFQLDSAQQKSFYDDLRGADYMR